MRLLLCAVLSAAGLVVADAAVAPLDCAAAAGMVEVAVVVDMGTAPGSPAGDPISVCVPVADRSTGAVVLAARAEALGTPAPRWDGSGLLCAIDGFPESGCGNRTDDGYEYWSYWQGDSGSWEYSSIGPATRRVKAGSVEGWRFVAGAGNPTDPPPRAAPDHGAICPTDPPPSTGGTLAPPVTDAPTPPSSADAGSTPDGGAGVTPSTATVPGSTATDGSPSGSSAPTGGPTSSTVAQPPGEEATAASPADGRRQTPGDTADDSRDTDGELAAGETPGASPSSGPPAGLLIGVTLLVVVGGAAVMQTRRARALDG